MSGLFQFFMSILEKKCFWRRERRERNGNHERTNLGHFNIYRIYHEHTLDIKLISRSRSPILEEGELAFIADRVSFPVYTTAPTIVPEAITVSAHNVLSTVRDSISVS